MNIDTGKLLRDIGRQVREVSIENEIIREQIEKIRKKHPTECRQKALGYIVDQIENWNNEAEDYIENEIK